MMALKQNQPTQPGRIARADASAIRTSQPSEQAAAALAIPRLTRINREFVDATLGNKSGFATYGLVVGDATYRAVTFAIRSTVAVAGVTRNIAGVHYVNTAKLPDYLGTVRMVANGNTLQSLSVAEILIRNQYQAQDLGPVFTGFVFPGENMFWNRALVDAFGLGTLGLRSLTLEIQTKASFDANTMEIDVQTHAVSIPRPVGFCFKTDRFNQTFQGISRHTYWDLPVADDVANIWLIAEGIAEVKLTVDGEILFDMNRAQYESYLTTNGRDVSALAGGWMLDFHAEGDGRSLAALTTAQELKRNAKIKLEVVTTLETTPVEFLVTLAGIYNQIR